MQNTPNKKGNQNKELFNIQVLAKYLSYWPLFLFCVLVFLGVAFFYLRYTVPKFQADATLIIKDEKRGSDDNKTIESLNLINAKKLIENEVEVLQSRNLLNTVVKKLHLYAPVTQAGKLKSLSAYESSPLIIEALNPDSLMEAEKVKLDYNPKTGLVVLNNSYSGTINKWLNTPYGTLKFNPNYKRKPASENKPYFFSLVPVKGVAAGILGNLKVTASSKLASLIELTYKDESPKRAEDILNELIASYADAALDEKNILAYNTLSFIEERLNVVTKELDSIEGKLQRYKAGTGAVDISHQGQLYLDNVNANGKRIGEVSMQLSALDQLKNYASSPGSAGVIPSTLGINDPTLTLQLQTLNGLQMKYDQLKGTVAENHPNLVAITSQINQIKPTILKNIESQQQNLEQSKNDLYSSGGTYNSLISSIPQKEKQLLEITRDRDIKNGIYSFLLTKREESKLSLASSISDSKVVNYAQSSTFPVSPNKMVIYIIAVVMAIAFPIVYITGREALSPKILYRHEIESLTKLPIIGEITFNKSKGESVIKAGSRTILAEEFRKIRVSLLSLGINAVHKKILVTSSISGEGKSFIAANLATSISLTGKKTVLVDLDLHNPGLGKFFGIKEQFGISDYLVGKKTVNDIIYKIPESESLFYISSGTLQQDSSELLENGAIQKLITQLDDSFDMVIIDSAPIVLITDSYLLSSLCDATLYVIMHKVTPKILVRRIDDNMEVNPIKNAAILFNGVKTRGYFKNNYGYGYNSVYGYGDVKKNKYFAKKKV